MNNLVKLFYKTEKGKVYSPISEMDLLKDCPLQFLSSETKTGANECWLVPVEKAVGIGNRAFLRKTTIETILREEYESFIFKKPRKKKRSK